MAVKIRLQRHGRKKRPFYHIVIADARSPRDGRFIEKIGYYNPMTKPATIDLDRDKAYEWLMKGAQPTNTANAILRFKGILYKKHLMLGVKKGALTQEDADAKYLDFINAKDEKIAQRFEQSAREELERLAKISGVPPKIEAPVVEEPAAEEGEDDGSTTVVEMPAEDFADEKSTAAEGDETAA